MKKASKPAKKKAQKPARAAKAKKPVKKAAKAKVKKPLKAKKPPKAAKAKKSAKKPPKLKKQKSRSAKFRHLRYALHQKVVYPIHGVGEITSIEERLFLGKKEVYYIIYLDVPDMTVMMPAAKADEHGIRPIVSKNEAQKALTVIARDYQPISADWKMRYQMNLDLLKKGSVTDIAKVVRSLYNRSKIKELPILERKLYDSAIKLLIDEISYSLHKDKDEVETMIYKKMETK
jgi:CarD family transcriptional regulator